ncbi:hypothetical protein NHF50_00105 [Flavobacterium sp. NRK F10]|uniref:hypothetical protein n=1 Tax=Flavobacterium sp. NRK F10 TaxID=2954931 RepID=UPI0020901EB0|nr:hypothetical protein [Flavobacterium sp. NRK F10]MCO6173437.1 hypothetical protein [Flavobacterium sp. NRK F10]
MKIIILIAFMLNVSCSKEKKSVINTESKEFENKKEKIFKDESNQSGDFLDFIKNFKDINLPLEIKYKDVNWFDFNSDEELIEIDKVNVLKYLLNNDESKILQSDGGIKQFYYGYKILFPNKSIGLVYYRTDEDYVGFVMTLYSSEYKYLGELFLAGSKGEYDITAQKDVFIDNQGKIIVTELKLNNKDNVQLGSMYITTYDYNLKLIANQNKKDVKINFDANLSRMYIQ